jgi:hypothetical protein
MGSISDIENTTNIIYDEFLFLFLLDMVAYRRGEELRVKEYLANTIRIIITRKEEGFPFFPVFVV